MPRSVRHSTQPVQEVGFVAYTTVTASIAARPEAMCDIMSDHRILHTLVPHIVKSVNIRSWRAQTYVAEERLVFGNKCHRYRVIGGDAKGSSVTERFEDNGEYTHLHISIHWKYRFWMKTNWHIQECYQEMVHRVAKSLEN